MKKLDWLKVAFIVTNGTIVTIIFRSVTGYASTDWQTIVFIGLTVFFFGFLADGFERS